MEAELLIDERHVLGARAFVEIVVWRVPYPLRGSNHRFKYRLAPSMGLAYCATTTRPSRAITDTCEMTRSLMVPPTRTRCWQIFGATSKTGSDDMKTVTLQVAKLDEIKRRAQDAFKGKKQGSRISFATPELLFRLLTAKRWELIRALTGAGPLAIREAARRVNRDVKAVHGDVHALLKAGVLRKTEAGLVVFPFDAIHVDVILHAA